MKTVIVNVNLEYAFDVDNDEEAKIAAEEVELPAEYVCDSFDIVKVLDGNQTVSQKARDRAGAFIALPEDENKQTITYKASGIVLGNYWGGGQGSYAAETLTADTLLELEQQILDGIKDGSLDSGMGYESLIGALMNIETIETRVIDDKTFIATENEHNCYGDLSEEQHDFLLECIYSC